MLLREAEVRLEHSGARIDQVAALLWPEFSRAQFTRWIRAGELTLDKQRVAPKQRVLSGQKLVLKAQPVDQSAAWQTPQRIPFDVAYEDEDLLVVNKPAGLVVHPGAGNIDGTLVNGLLDYRPELRQMPRAGIVHRLDKDTSGLLLVAATLSAHTHLVRELAARRIQRQYLAIVEGQNLSDQTVDRAIARDTRVRTRQRVSTSGRAAVTHVQVLARFRSHCMIRATLETGRTHQIRVHLSSLGHPLVGDRRYGWRRQVPVNMTAIHREQLTGFARQALHAQWLAYEHPNSGLTQSFEAPLPRDLQSLRQVLEEDSKGYPSHGES